MTGLSAPPLKKEVSVTQWLADLRTQAYARYEKTGFPTRQWEAWKYMDLAPMNAALAGTSPKNLADVILDDINPYLIKPEAARIVFVNGVYSKPLSFCGKPGKFTLEHLESAFRSHPSELNEHLGKLTTAEKSTFVDINTFSFRDGVFLSVPEGTQVEGAIELLFIHTEDHPEPLIVHPRILILVGKNAKAHVVSSHIALGQRVCAGNEVMEAYLEPSAELEYVNVHRGGPKAVQFFTGFFSLKEKSVLKAFTFVDGEGVTRSDIKTHFDGPGAQAFLQGLALLSGVAQVFTHATADHEAQKGLSRQSYKNILSGQSQSEFNSLVSVRPTGAKTDSQQLSRSLLLSEGAVAHARPQLRIDIDDVVCAHGATVGQLQKGELFYLRTRGLSEKDARFMLTFGFAEETLNAVELPLLREMLRERISEKLGKIVGV